MRMKDNNGVASDEKAGDDADTLKTATTTNPTHDDDEDCSKIPQVLQNAWLSMQTTANSNRAESKEAAKSRCLIC